MHAFTSIVSLFALLATTASAISAPSHVKFLQRRASSVTPTSPGPGSSFDEGAQCAMEWTPGTGSAWKSMTISLMTGANLNMTKLTDVGTNIDGTTLSSYSWTCPTVTPNSAIYFYQFTDKNGANPTWTTRFTIAGTNGASTAPTNSKQADGEAIPWGEGALASSSSSSSNSTTSSSAPSSSSTSSPSSASTTDSSSTSSTVSAASSESTVDAGSSSSGVKQGSSSSGSSTATTSSASSSTQIFQTLCFSMAFIVVAAVMA